MTSVAGALLCSGTANCQTFCTGRRITGALCDVAHRQHSGKGSKPGAYAS